MYRAIVVDDEKMIRDGIRDTIRWDQVGIEEVYTAASGRKALDIIAEKRPEIMITDINMRGMTGIELIGQAREFLPEMKVLVLTGYDEFEYARKCLRLKVQEFLLKPVDEKTLEQEICKLTEQLDGEKRKQKEQVAVLRTAGSRQQEILENIMRGLIYDQNSKELALAASAYGIERGKIMQLVILICEIQVEEKDGIAEGLLNMTIRNICMGLLDAHQEGITFFDRQDRVLLLLFGDNSNNIEAVEKTEEIVNVLREELDIRVRAVLGSVVTEPEELYISYNNAEYLLESALPFQQITQTVKAKNRRQLFADTFTELKNRMLIELGNAEETARIMDIFEIASDSYNVADSVVRRCCFELVSALYFAVVSNGGEEKKGNLDAFSYMILRSQRKEVFTYTKDYIEKLFYQEEGGHQIVKRAETYIRNHLEEDLSVGGLAAQVYLSPNYFSKLFKKFTGKGCNEYIVFCRMEKAKQLLESTNLKAGEVGQAVGYHEINYFSLAFKKQTGLSPIKYREKFREDYKR